MDREWAKEPNRKHWIDEETGFDCLIVRNGLGGIGALCGYVGLPKGHPWYGKSYDDCRLPGGEYVDVHGGLTFASGCGGKICHNAEEDGVIANEEVWWVGFDCCHSGDFTPGMDDIESKKKMGFPAHLLRERGGVYRNIAYVEDECRSLARQAKAV